MSMKLDVNLKLNKSGWLEDALNHKKTFKHRHGQQCTVFLAWKVKLLPRYYHSFLCCCNFGPSLTSARN